MKFVGGGVGVGVGVGVGEGDGEGVGEGEGVGVTCCDTVQIHVCRVVPFALLTIAETFHVPIAALVLV